MKVTTSKLEEVHIKLWELYNPPSSYGATYATIFMCEHTRKTLVLYLQGKDKFVDTFQAWLPKVKAESGCSMKALRPNGERDFISIWLCEFCKKRGITIKYPALYVYEENGLAKRRWRTIIAMKDIMLIDSGFPNNFWAKTMETANYLYHRLPTRSKANYIVATRTDLTKTKYSTWRVKTKRKTKKICIEPAKPTAQAPPPAPASRNKKA